MNEIAEMLATTMESHDKWPNGKDNVKIVDLRYSNLSNTNLRKANLSNTDFRRANFSNSDLRGAIFRNSDLRGAIFSGADLRDVDLRDTGLIVFQAGLWTAYISSESIMIGCQHHSVEAWDSFDDKAIADMHPHALAYWRDNKTIILAIVARLKERLEEAGS